MTKIKLKLITIFTLLTLVNLGQGKYQDIRYLPFYFDKLESIREQTSSGKSSYKLYYLSSNPEYIIVYSTTKPFPYDFYADSCTIMKTREMAVMDIRLFDSISTFEYRIDFFYKKKKMAKKNYKYLYNKFDLKSLEPSEVSKTVYFELENASPVCISHNLRINYKKLNKKIYNVSIIFLCNGDRDPSKYIWPKRW